MANKKDPPLWVEILIVVIFWLFIFGIIFSGIATVLLPIFGVVGLLKWVFFT